MHRSLLALVAILTLHLSATAQITFLPSTGCQNAAQTPVSGSNKLGGTLNVSSTQLPCNSPGTSGFVFLSITCLSVPPLGIGCFNNPCVLIDPLIVLSRPISYHLTINIPNDVRLVGFAFCVQGGCLSTFGGACIAPLNQAARVQVQR